MSIQLYLIFVAATALLIATPGPNLALIIVPSPPPGMPPGPRPVAAPLTGRAP